MSAQYQRFLKVLEKWPADKSKAGRDLGEQIRKQVTKLTTSLEGGATNQELDLQIGALERLSSNVYIRKYPRTFDSTATGLTAAQCNQVLSSEFLQYLNEGSKK
ncbi:ubiquinol-cytochrome-c reductase complex assembly factor 2 isoform X2 [Drosophila bipectinata]|uniref:ubiquinol-cytochrome-c reductase complex assembly factor 2 isoform X2 n=1 Tax=Drosophila bipectinata TaxID=42026 RepID=UPI001C8AAE7F|nr:ubiquinol-cytochrome-c reductase complex assembly factor 2 isoform X2 [Drosophila bipectinata]